MRISDWSSDVCSSDLSGGILRIARNSGRAYSAARLLGLARRQPLAVSQPRLGPRRELRAHRARGEGAARDRGPQGPAGRNARRAPRLRPGASGRDHLRSDAHTSELQSLMRISYAVICVIKTTKLVSHAVYTFKI